MKQTLADIDAAQLEGRTVLVRADLNVPLADGRITDDQRIRASIPTLRILLDSGARVVVLSHLGRPKGEVDPELSLAPVAERLGELLETPVTLIPDAHGYKAAGPVEAVPNGVVALLENTRFLPGETANDPELAASWAEMGDLFVNDAFGTAHRAHASTAGLAEAMTAKGGAAVAGLLMARELRFLEEVLRMPERPFIAIVGGAKISSKIGVISALLPRVDRLLIGGAMANTFFRALDLETGASLVEEDAIDLATRADRAGRASASCCRLDCVVTHGGGARCRQPRDVPRDSVGSRARRSIVDIGPRYARVASPAMISASKSIRLERADGRVRDRGLRRWARVAVAEAVATACDRGARSGVLGGGDSAAAAQRAGVVARLTHVSTGGGASLELLAGEPRLPGVDALSDR